MSKMKPIADKIACCMKEMYNSLETVIHNVNLDKEGIKTEPVNGKQQIEEPNSNKVDISNDHVKLRNQVKTFCEKYDCTVAFTVDEKSDQLVSVSIEQMNRIPDYIRVDVVSGSSGSLADHSSLSDSHSVNSLRKLPFQLPGRHSIPESSSASSASSVQQSSLRNFHQFLAPDKLPPNRSKNCICKCFCSLLKSSPAKTSVSATPDLLISSIENSKTETNNSKEIPQNTEEFLKGISHTSSEKVLSVDISELVKKDEALKTSNLSETSKSFEGFKLAETTKEEVSKNDSQSESKKVNKDLLVFGRWINKYYPGKIEDVTLEDWHDSDKPLKVLFFDGLPKMLANVFIIPATMLPPKMDIMCPVGDDLYEEGSLIKIENVIDENIQESLMFSVSIGDKVVSVPFEKVWFNESTKKQLGITPRKPKIPQLEMPWSSVLSRKRQLPSINEQNLTGKKDTTSFASAKSAKKLKTSGSSVKKATLNVKKEKLI
ncbi:hypothetical protein O3M35_007451 [Rhynocoris fuscipes]|uniref:Uncharacterized protein n=1 Tax=Rhynocoris fuscipes TaxID=488301 RepID=A0AAW1DGM4_9HEMI